LYSDRCRSESFPIIFGKQMSGAGIVVELKQANAVTFGGPPLHGDFEL
jgi:hypothetical protein